jgi:8-oxo-dGTP pyrophosphatase MutT (NUDIX family)
VSLALSLRQALDRTRDHDLPIFHNDARDRRPQAGQSGVDAAVLIPIVERPSPTVLLTRRTETLSSHAGQVAFPGGRIDDVDDGPIAAALREAEEEIGLPTDVVDIIGTTDLYYTGTGFHITPVLAVIPPDLPLTPWRISSKCPLMS